MPLIGWRGHLVRAELWLAFPSGRLLQPQVWGVCGQKGSENSARLLRACRGPKTRLPHSLDLSASSCIYFIHNILCFQLHLVGGTGENAFPFFQSRSFPRWDFIFIYISWSLPSHWNLGIYVFRQIWGRLTIIPCNIFCSVLSFPSGVLFICIVPFYIILQLPGGLFLFLSCVSLLCSLCWIISMARSSSSRTVLSFFNLLLNSCR